MKAKTTRLLAILLTLFSFYAQAQEKSYSGVVTSSEDGLPVPGVNVVVLGKGIGTSTDIDGAFKVTAAKGDELQFTFIGMTAKTIRIGTNAKLEVVMDPDNVALDEVVVTALGISREKKALGYATQEVGGAALDQAKETNVVNSLAGKVAGVQVYSNSGNMGGSSRVVIRGVNSITGNNQPLFVVDGVPVNNSNFNSTNTQRGGGGYDYGNAIQDINPDDIETMNVLKGAAAAALYGTRASNGVIIITTKKGKKNKAIGVDYTYGVEMSNVYILPDYQNSYGGGFGFSKLYYNDHPEAFGNRGSGHYPDDGDGMGSYDLIPDYAVDEAWGPKLDQGDMVRHWWSWDEGHPDFGKVAEWKSHPNNIRDFFNTGVTQRHNVSFTGGNDNGNFRMSYTNMNQDFVLPNSGMNKNNVSFNGGYNFTEQLTVTIGANYINQAAIGRPGTGYSGNNVMQQFNQWGQRQWDMDKMRDYKNADGSQRTWNRKAWNNPVPKYTDNPYWTRYENYQNDSRERMFGNIALNYQAFDFLAFSAKASTDFYNDKREERIAIGSQNESYYSQVNRFVQETNIDLMANFNKTFNEVHNIAAIAGYNTRQNKYNSQSGWTRGGLVIADWYDVGNSKSDAATGQYRSLKQVESLYGSVSYGWNRMVYVDATFRKEWSSTLPADNWSYLFPSASTSFVFSELIDANWFSFGKLRAGWAQVGSDTDAYRLNNVYSANSPFGSAPSYYVPNRLNNSELRPEITEEFEVGLEMNFFESRLGVDFTYYDRNTTDQIIPITVSASSGFTSAVINAGKMTNKGFELALNGTPVLTDSGFRWDLGFNIAHNKNEVVELFGDLTLLPLANAPFAVSTNAIVGQPYGTILGYNYTYHENGERIVKDGKYVRSAKQEAIGNAMADYTGGFSTNFSYKGWSLAAMFDFQIGGDMFSTTNMWAKYSGMTEETAANGIREDGIIVDGVTADGQPNTVSLSAGSHFFYNGGYVLNAADVYDASYVTLREMNLGYSLPAKYASKVGLAKVKLSAYGRNLWLIHSNIPHLDPTNLALGSGNIQGLEGASLPSVRSFGLNLTVGF